MDNEQIARDIEALRRGQEEILALLKGQVRQESEVLEFRDMVRHGADPHETFRDIQRRRRAEQK